MSTASRTRALAVAAVVLAAAGLCAVPSARATTYNNPGPFLDPWVEPSGMPGLPAPVQVPGKECAYQSDTGSLDILSGAASATAAQQVVDWDGRDEMGGTAAGLDYTGKRSAYLDGGRLDALANFYDTLFYELKSDRVHLIFSVSRTMSADSSSPQPGAVLAVPAAGPIPVRDGSIGGAGELSYELAGDPSYQPVGDLTPGRLGVWAKRETLNVDDPPSDLDALELWGPEPTSDFVGDANKYSLQSDYDSFNKAIPDDAVSVWNGDANGTPFIRQSVIVEAVTSLLVPPAGITATDLAPLVDVDALMVQNMPGASPNVFDAATPHGPDMVIFSIRQIQIPDPADPDHLIYYATGSEIFWLEADGDCGFLRHGGHDWDKDYALAALSYSADGGTGVLDINALEAVAVPEPAALVLLLLGIVSLRLGGLARRRPA